MAKVRRITTAGLNVRWPWSELIVSGQKNIETRGYALPERFIGKYLAVIETGNEEIADKKPSSHIIGLIRISSCRKYTSRKQWLADFPRHKVSPTDPTYSFSTDKEKWAWEIQDVCKVAPAIAPPKTRGIKFAKRCSIPTSNILLGDLDIESLLSRCTS
jgi:hypothetical protein